MRFYADTGAKFTRQVVGDMAAILVVIVGTRAVIGAYRAVGELAEPGRRIESSGNSLQNSFDNAADKVDNVPGVGGSLRSPFDSAARAADQLSGAGQQLQDVVHAVAVIVGALVAIVPLLLVLGWLCWRLWWVWRSTAARALADVSVDMFALRALVRQPLPRLAKVSRGLGTGAAVDLAEGWRLGDDRVVVALAALELRTLGVSPASRRQQPASRQAIP